MFSSSMSCFYRFSHEAEISEFINVTGFYHEAKISFPGETIVSIGSLSLGSSKSEAAEHKYLCVAFLFGSNYHPNEGAKTELLAGGWQYLATHPRDPRLYHSKKRALKSCLDLFQFSSVHLFWSLCKYTLICFVSVFFSHFIIHFSVAAVSMKFNEGVYTHVFISHLSTDLDGLHP